MRAVEAARPVSSASAAARRLGFGMLWAISSLLLAATMMSWSLAACLFSTAPDESAQVIRAAAVVRGELLGVAADPRRPALMTVEVPKVFTSLNSICLTPTGAQERCQLTEPGRVVSATTYVGRYPPSDYAIVGLPSLLGSSPKLLYAMRASSAVLCALLLGWALAAAVIWGRSRLLLAALAVAFSPSVLSLSGVVNPNGLEMAAAACFWIAGLMLALGEEAEPPRGSVLGFALSGMLLNLARPLSPLWTLLIVLLVIALAPRRWLALRASRALRWGLGLLASSWLVAWLWILLAGSTSASLAEPNGPSNLGFGPLVQRFLEQLGSFGRGLVDTFGINVWRPARGLLPLVGLAAIIVLVAGLSAAWRSRAVVVLATVLVGLVGDWAIYVLSVHFRHEYLDDGRYGYPLFVGAVLMAGAVALRPQRWAWRRGPSPTSLVIGLAAVAQLIAFSWATKTWRGFGLPSGPLPRAW